MLLARLRNSNNFVINPRKEYLVDNLMCNFPIEDVLYFCVHIEVLL